MDGYDYLAGFLLLFVFFIYITWFGFSVKVENQKEKSEKWLLPKTTIQISPEIGPVPKLQ